ncbi:ACT domain-containing protein [Desulfococcaceae bacterium HSG9]|nr:ACT domain-containing protein [Desulfococcaceae bacterium HSG9]
MNKVIISVLGQDRPGILAAVTKILLERDGNVENVSQTILQNQFVGIFIVSVPDHIKTDALKDELNLSVKHLDLDIHVKQLVYDETYYPPVKSEPFIITTKGLDRKGLVAGITATVAYYGVNVTNLQAIFKGGDNPGDNIMIYEVDIPVDIDQQELEDALRTQAQSLGLTISIWHRNIFKAINRI